MIFLGINLVSQAYNIMTKIENENKPEIGRRIYQWLSYLVVVIIVLIGIGILTKILLPEPFLAQQTQRLAIGGITLAYGIARIVIMILKQRKRKLK